MFAAWDFGGGVTIIYGDGCRMMPGLLEGQEKMSKSDPNSAIFMEDSEAEVSAKIKKAFCPPQASTQFFVKL
jgi:tryptophanyl-tRNA synthetase